MDCKVLLVFIFRYNNKIERNHHLFLHIPYSEIWFLKHFPQPYRLWCFSPLSEIFLYFSKWHRSMYILDINSRYFFLQKSLPLVMLPLLMQTLSIALLKLFGTQNIIQGVTHDSAVLYPSYSGNRKTSVALSLKQVQNVTTHDYFQHCYSDARTTIAHECCSSLLSPMLLNPHLPIMKPLAKVAF